VKTVAWLRSVRSRFSLVGEMWSFLWARKIWWMAPLVLLLLLLSMLVVFTEGSALAPFIYTLF
jgi:hypothetical protein